MVTEQPAQEYSTLAIPREDELLFGVCPRPVEMHELDGQYGDLYDKASYGL